MNGFRAILLKEFAHIRRDQGTIFFAFVVPALLYWVGFILPVTYFIEILRGVILRAADLADLAPQIGGLCLVGAAILATSVLRFRKQLD